jgi:hypothetical protein
LDNAIRSENQYHFQGEGDFLLGVTAERNASLHAFPNSPKTKTPP